MAPTAPVERALKMACECDNICANESGNCSWSSNWDWQKYILTKRGWTEEKIEGLQPLEDFINQEAEKIRKNHPEDFEGYDSVDDGCNCMGTAWLTEMVRFPSRPQIWCVCSIRTEAWRRAGRKFWKGQKTI
jgi:hypothetical protein